MKILVVDDEHVALSVTVAALRENGYDDVTTAASGQQALDRITASPEPFDCFLLDMRMPGMDGVELCGRIRTFPSYHTTPILFVTTVTDRAAINAAYAAGATDYLSKPIDTVEIALRLSTIEKLVEEERELRRVRVQAAEMRRQIEHYFDFGYADAVAIADVPNVTSRLAFENFLLGLGRFRLYASQVVAFRFDEFEEIYHSVAPMEAYNLLTDVADAISMSLKHSESLICYAGSGEFLCVTGRSASVIHDDLPVHINIMLEEFGLTYEDGRPLTATVTMGAPAMASILTVGDPLSLIDTAIRSVRGSSSKALDATEAQPDTPREDFNRKAGSAA